MLPLWTPTPSIIQQSQLTQYRWWLEKNLGLTFSTYQELWLWSTEQHELFWQSLIDYFKMIEHGTFSNVTNGKDMPFTRWFEGSKINYAEHIFRQKSFDRPAILHLSEKNLTPENISWNQLERDVATIQQYLISKGVEKGDRVVGYLTNTPHATIAMLATVSLGAIWSCCSPDFGVSSVIDRFRQISPKVLFATDGYLYGGKRFERGQELSDIVNQLETLKSSVYISFIGDVENVAGSDSWDEILQSSTGSHLFFQTVDFNDPIWILYSSGTTGKPKAITHSHGGMLLEHLKYLTFHNDVKIGERFFWYSTTGWMMWNFVHASLLVGATIVLYEGSPAYPDISFLWKMASDLNIHHFGTSAPFIVACMKKGLDVRATYDLSSLRSIGSTGSPLPPEGFDYVYEKIHDKIWLTSMSGGTDVCTAFVGGNISLPVYEGQIQSRTLGCALFALSDDGRKVKQGEVGEMVIVKPMPCMPIYFWNDDESIKYIESYFTVFDGLWRHGDWIKITDEEGIIILGRSDATLNRHGVRIGTAEIYASLNKIEKITDALVVNLELEGGKHYMPLFVVLEEGHVLDEALKKEIAMQLKADYSPRHVPDEIFEVDDLPYTISGKKLETPVKKILLGMAVDRVSNKDAIRNPNSLDYFKKFKIK
ncbi:MAG: acetoacetate--CoA ligase [Saprospiraceae bacterium]